MKFQQVLLYLKLLNLEGYNEHVEKDHTSLTLWNMEHTFAGQVHWAFIYLLTYLFA